MLSVADLTISPAFSSAIEFAVHDTVSPWSALVGMSTVSDTVVNVWVPVIESDEFNALTSRNETLV